MKTFILLVAVLGAAVATKSDIAEAFNNLHANVYMQGISDQVLGWTDPSLTDACQQKLPSIVALVKAFYQSFTTFDFAQIEAAYSALYNSYTTFPQCSYTTNIFSHVGYVIVAKEIYKELAPISRKAAKTFGILAQILYDFTAGLEGNLQTSYVVVTVYNLITNTANVTNTQIADVIGYFVRMAVYSLIYTKPGPKPHPDMWQF